MSAWLRRRHASTLTVLMFHRVLARDDPRAAHADPYYTLDVEVFARTLAFVRRHYRPVSIDEVLAAHAGESRLPARAALLTFDDGWADNARYAAPLLRQAGVPALVFVVADAVGTRQPFWQERLIHAQLRGALDLPALQAAAGIAQGQGAQGVRDCIRRLEELPGEDRARLLAPFAAAMDDGHRHMVDADDLATLAASGVAIGLHGKSHVQLTRAASLQDELEGGLQRMRDICEPRGMRVCPVLSFPHGAHDAAVTEATRQAGYALAFTSVPAINAVDSGPAFRQARVSVDTRAVTDAQGRFREDRLAITLFRRPVVRLD